MGDPQRHADNPDEVRPAVPTARWSPDVRRSYPRFNISCIVMLRPEDRNASLGGKVANISRGGALIRTQGLLDESKRHRLEFLPDGEGHYFAGHECPDCGHVFGALCLRRMSVWARVLRQGRGGGDGWAAAVEFETLIDLGEDS